MIFPLAALISQQSPAAAAPQASFSLRVGYYDAEPSCWRDESGEPSGIFVDAIRGIAKSKGWNLTFLYREWDELLNGLRDGSIDIVMAIVRTRERETFAAFTEQSVMTDWGAVYAREGSGIKTVLDLHQRTVGALKNDFWFSGSGSLADLCLSFGLQPKYSYYPDYSSLFIALNQGKIDSVAASNSLGLVWQNRVPIQSTPVIYNPIELRFAVSRAGPHGDALAMQIDGAMAGIKLREPDFFRNLLDRYQVPVRQEYVTPLWVSVILGVLAASLLLLTLLLYRQTRALKRSTANATAAAAGLQAAKDELEATLLRKDHLVHELSHRVKNNLQLVLSLFGLANGDKNGYSCADALSDLREKIYAISLVEEEIHEHGGLDENSLNVFLSSLAHRIEFAKDGKAARFTWSVSFSGCTLAPLAATPLALIVSELAANSVSHGSDSSGSAWLSLEISTLPEGSARLAFRDKGRGFSPGFTPERDTGLGYRLIMALVSQLGGALHASNNDGSEVLITIPRENWILPRSPVV